MKRITTLLFLQRSTEAEDEILLAMKKRGFGQGLWNGIGGKTEPGETPEQAVIRECQEEINVTVTPQSLQKIGELQFLDASDPSFEHYCHLYISREWQGTPRPTEEMRPRWFSVTKIPYNTMWPGDRLWFPLVVAGLLFTGSLTMDFAHNNKITDVQLHTSSSQP